MFAKLLTSALFAGFATGLAAAALQFAFVQPVLLEAELYETGRLVHFGAEGGAAAGEAAALLSGGIEWTRDILTVLFTALVYSGYALLLVAGFALAERQGAEITPRRGLVWGLAGFVAVQFAPAAGLPPELPGVAAADVYLRQLWWAATVAATAGGLWLLAFGAGALRLGLGVVLIAAPHVVGAPHPEVFTGPVPPELGGLFASRALGVGLAAWSLLGVLAAWFWQREGAAAPRPAAARSA